MVQIVIGLLVIVFAVWPAVQWVWGLSYGPAILVIAVLVWGAALK